MFDSHSFHLASRVFDMWFAMCRILKSWAVDLRFLFLSHPFYWPSPSTLPIVRLTLSNASGLTLPSAPQAGSPGGPRWGWVPLCPGSPLRTVFPTSCSYHMSPTELLACFVSQRVPRTLPSAQVFVSSSTVFCPVLARSAFTLFPIVVRLGFSSLHIILWQMVSCMWIKLLGVCSKDNPVT